MDQNTLPQAALMMINNDKGKPLFWKKSIKISV